MNNTDSNDTDDAFPEVPTNNQVELFSSLGTLLAVTTTVSTFLVIRRIFCKPTTPDWYDEFMEGQELDPDLPFAEQAKLLPYDPRWEFPKSRLKFGKTIGQGAFGKVVLAKAIGLLETEPTTIVAVKVLKDKTSQSQQKALLAELKILMHLGHHVNIMNLLGAVTRSRKGPMVIVEYCRYGNLRHYLLKNRRRFASSIKVEFRTLDRDTFSSKRTGSTGEEGSFSSSSSEDIDRLPKKEISVGYRKSDSGKPKPGGFDSGNSEESDEINFQLDRKKHRVTTDDLICYSYQCSRGMEYLSSRRLVHRDLAARNVLLSDNKIIKICDFGLAKELYEYPHYVKKGDTPLPIKWMAIESIGDRVFTTKSDVWSFGVLLWEFFTLGGTPYPGMEVDENFYSKLKDGYRMEKPEYAPEHIYKIMSDCWKASPGERPHFRELSRILGDLVGEKVKQYYIDLNEPYMKLNQLALQEQSKILPAKGDEIPLSECDGISQAPCTDDDQSGVHPQDLNESCVEDTENSSDDRNVSEANVEKNPEKIEDTLDHRNVSEGNVEENPEKIENTLHHSNVSEGNVEENPEKTEDTLDHRNVSKGDVEENPLRVDDVSSPTSHTSDVHTEGSLSDENDQKTLIETSATVHSESSAEDSESQQPKSVLVSEKELCCSYHL